MQVAVLNHSEPAAATLYQNRVRSKQVENKQGNNQIIFRLSLMLCLSFNVYLSGFFFFLTPKRFSVAFLALLSAAF